MTQNIDSEEDAPKTLKQITLGNFSDTLMWCLFSWASYASNSMFISGVCLGMATPYLAQFMKNSILLYAEYRLNKYP